MASKRIVQIATPLPKTYVETARQLPLLVHAWALVEEDGQTHVEALVAAADERLALVERGTATGIAMTFS
jgi:hypothetical protein